VRCSSRRRPVPCFPMRLSWSAQSGLVREQVEKLRRNIAAELLGFYRCENHRRAEDFRRFRQHQHIIEQVLTVNVRHAKNICGW